MEPSCKNILIKTTPLCMATTIHLASSGIHACSLKLVTIAGTIAGTIVRMAKSSSWFQCIPSHVSFVWWWDSIHKILLEGSKNHEARPNRSCTVTSFLSERSAIWTCPYSQTPYADSRNPRMGICRLNTLIDLIFAFDYFVLEIGSESSPKSKENGLKIFLANPRGFLCGGRSSY